MHSMSDLLKISSKLFEAELQKSDVGAIFKTAEKTAKNWAGKAPETADTLIQKWKNSGFLNDSKDIVSILKSFGYSDSAINKVFKKAGYGQSDDVAVSPAIEKLSQYIIQEDYTDVILQFMKSEYPELTKSYVKEGIMAIEDIRAIFTDIMNEDRAELPEIIRQRQQQNLGRYKK